MKARKGPTGGRDGERSGSRAAGAPLEALVRGVLLGTPGTWQALVTAITPQIVAITRAHPSMREKKLSHLDDDVAEVTTASLERLARDDFKNLRRFLGQVEEGGDDAAKFDAWLYGAVDFTIRDHLRKRFGRAPRPDDTGRRRPSRRDLGTFAGRVDEAPLDHAFLSTLGATKRTTVAEIFAYAAEHFEPLEVQAMRLFYLEDKDLGELAEMLGLPDERAADKLIRRLNARLRYHFVRQPGNGG